MPMRHPNNNNQPDQYPATSSTPPVEPGCPQRLLRAGPILALIVVLAAVFGTGLFIGWEIGTRSGAHTTVLQPGTNPGTALPPLNGEHLDTVREAVVVKVRPAVVQVNVATSQGQGLGSGVIIDQ